MQMDWRAPQFVTHIDRNERSGFFLQFAMHAFCSPRHRMGTVRAVCGQSRPSVVSAAPKAGRKTDLRESTVFMSISYEGRQSAAIGRAKCILEHFALLAPAAC